ncbi:hypothetical protein KEM48_011129 [Puccinia striiformis f. sp. tritici PST-130]|nr:hypothetical protein KEM48_011129 [Puccinia striiformis f. sp. tritici PST-130]
MTWQAYPVGLGTATGYILLANLKTHPAFLTKIEILLFIMNIIIFSLTTGLMCYDNRGNCQLRILINLRSYVKNFEHQQAWAFPVFPLLLTGVVTFNVLRIVPLTDPRADFWMAIRGFRFPNPFADITQRWRDLFVTGCVMVGIMLTGCSALLFTMAAIPYWTRLRKCLQTRYL